MIIELYRQHLRDYYNGDVQKMIEAGECIEWTPERIKSAFNFGNGTEADLKKHMLWNRSYCVFIDTDIERI